jgi:hypothetical protein
MKQQDLTVILQQIKRISERTLRELLEFSRKMFLALTHPINFHHHDGIYYLVYRGTCRERLERRCQYAQYSGECQA